MSFQASVGQFYCLRSLSLPVIHLSIFKWGERLCQAALQGRKHPIQSQESVSFIINYTDCYRACLCHQRSPVWHLFILPFQQKPKETLGLFSDTRDLMRWQCKQRSLSAWTAKENNLIVLYWKDLKLLLWLGEKSMDNSHFSSDFLALLTLAWSSATSSPLILSPFIPHFLEE